MPKRLSSSTNEVYCLPRSLDSSQAATFVLHKTVGMILSYSQFSHNCEGWSNSLIKYTIFSRGDRTHFMHCIIIIIT